MNKLLVARNEIDAIDKELANLYEKRMQAVVKVAQYKKENGMPIFDESREKAVIEKNTAYLSDDSLKSGYVKVLNKLMEVSKDYQRQAIYGNSIGYQGILGAFSHIAAKRLFPDSNLLSYSSFRHVVDAIEEGTINAGILPFENSSAGEVGDVMNLLFKHPDLYIEAYYDLKVEQNLLGIKAAKREDIKKVYSHQQALDQASNYLRHRGYELISYPNTALAASFVSEKGDFDKAAIASKETAEIYGLDILEDNIQNIDSNYTRFVIVSKKPHNTGEKTGIFFTVKNEAGCLAEIINIISASGFNMSSLISHAMPELPWEYYFFVQLDCSSDTDDYRQMAQELIKHCQSYRCIGSYSKI